MRSLHDLFELKSCRADDICLRLPFENRWKVLDELWNGRFAIGVQNHAVHFSAVGNSNVSDGRTFELSTKLARFTVELRRPDFGVAILCIKQKNSVVAA